MNGGTSNMLKVVTLCSGYDSQCLALNRLGIDYELVAWSEIDKYAIQAHNALFPQWKDRNLGDMTKIDWTKVPDFDLLTYSTPCFTGDTLVLTSNGYKLIKDINTDDCVITHTNHYKKVVKPMVKCYKGTIYSINAMCSNVIKCTPEHPFYVREMYRQGHKSIRKFKDPIFKNAKELTKKDYLGIAINMESKLPQWDGVEDNRFGHHKKVNEISKLFTNESFWYVIGRYIGDGWQRDDAAHKGIIICSNDDKLHTLLASLDNCNINYSVSKERTVNKVIIYLKELLSFVKRYGKYAYGKRIDGETIALPVHLLKSFLQGYIESDGCFTNGYYKATTVSRELAYGLAQCIEKVYKAPCKIYFSKRPKKHIIEDRIVNQKDTWVLNWKFDVRKQDKAFYENGYIWFPIKKIETREEECEVYNMEVEEEHSYTANGAIVHNCQSISNAGLQHGFTEGSGTRSSIIWFVREAIKVKKPKYLMLENVAAMVSAKFLPMFHLWQHELEKYGYTNYAQVLNAKDYGVPQNRERIFMISKLDNEPFYFPKPFKLEKRLKDVLEKNVDEKY